MNIYFVIAIAAVCLVLMLIWLSNRKAAKPKYRQTLPRVLEITRRDVTPAGTTILIEDGASASMSAKYAIDAGLSRCFEKAACAGYRRAVSHRDYQVAILRTLDHDSQGFPAYRLPAGPYLGTEFDKGGYVIVSGEMAAVGEPYGNIIAVAEHIDRFEHMSAVCEYEAEHVILAWNNGEEFERTKVHGSSTGHPIIADCNGSFARTHAFASRMSMQFGDYTGSAALPE